MGVAAARVAPVLALALLLVLAGVATGATVGASPEPAVSQSDGHETAPGPAQVTPGAAPPETTTVIRINLHPDGDARWNVTTTVALESDTDRQAFQQLAEEHERGEVETISTTPFENAAQRAATITGRPMDIENIDRVANRGESVGTLSLRFTWANFSRTQGDEIRLGDVFQSPTGTWLPALGPNQILVIEFPDGYTVRDSSRRLTNGTIRVEGPATFEPGQPSAVLRETTSTLPNNGLETEEILGLVLGVAVLVGGLVYLLTRRRRRGPSEDEDAVRAAAGEAASEPTEASESSFPDVGDPEGTTTPGDVDTMVGAAGDEPAAEEEPLLSDEERVERLLSANGGRMKQVDIVAETGWSNAKVSQLLSAMDEDGRVEKLRIGRENLISLPEYESEH
ncbi:MAG: LPXTG cell wall anchor domain-containing protein [Halobacteriales archaeon]|nr:LPXTG cell wall anchor domain-containing protein [Halobacteriales archaeon]